MLDTRSGESMTNITEVTGRAGRCKQLENSARHYVSASFSDFSQPDAGRPSVRPSVCMFVNQGEQREEGEDRQTSLYPVEIIISRSYHNPGRRPLHEGSIPFIFHSL